MIRHQMANLFFHLECTIGLFIECTITLALVLVVAHTANNLDLSHERNFEMKFGKELK